MSEVLEAIRKRLSDDFKSEGYDVMLLQELRELKRSKVADTVLSYCNFMKVHEIDALMDELDDTIYIGTKKAVTPISVGKVGDTSIATSLPQDSDREEPKSPPELAALGYEEEKKRGRRPRLVKEVTRDNGEPDAPALPEISNPDDSNTYTIKPSLDKLLGDEDGDT